MFSRTSCIAQRGSHGTGLKGVWWEGGQIIGTFSTTTATSCRYYSVRVNGSAIGRVIHVDTTVIGM